ncbi:MAG: hypothetical protein H6R10_421 [Rhodocyclaceae bacterium]|nr:hypothetical protein [Rhodocyclaceae bacterium]
MRKLLPLLALIVFSLAGCASLQPGPAFKSVSISVGGGGYGMASRSLSADGTVFGTHMSGSPGGAPMISESTEQARPQDLAEVAQLVRDLPEQGEIPPPASLGGPSVIILEVAFADDSIRRFYRPENQDFKDKRLARLQAILRSYRAGYW